MEYQSYKNLAKTVGIHFFIMYSLTYVAVNTWSDASLFSTRSFYMAVVMVAPMVILMLFFMGSMYKDKKLNRLLYLGSFTLFIGALFFIRGQVLVGNEQFLYSMIPHHSGAITMCEEASITDQEILDLCDEIVKAQQEEIDQMNAILERLN